MGFLLGFALTIFIYLIGYHHGSQDTVKEMKRSEGR